MPTRILVLGKDFIIGHFSSLLSSSGFEVTGVRGLSESLEKLEVGPYALVMVDERLTEAEEACRSIRQKFGPPVALLLSDSQKLEELIHFEVDALLSRSMVREEVGARIKAILRRYKMRESSL